MVINLNRGPFLNIPDKLHPGQYRVIKNPDWDGCLPDIITFTEFLKWNYTLDYGRYVRESHDYGVLPLPYGVPQSARIENVIISEGHYDRIDHYSFEMYVICEVYFVFNGFRLQQQYIVYGIYVSGGVSDFLRGIDLYDGKYIRLKNPLDACLVPKMNKKKFRKIAKEMLEEFYPCEITAPCWINVYALAKAMGLDIRYARLSKNAKVKVRSKLIFDSRDALDGKIDLIVTKSVSRFARNTVDSLTTVRKLKEKGVEVYFEKENIYTLDSKGELFITIMSSLAQEESRSISENVTWGQRKRMADGKVTMPYGRFLGYRKGEDGLPEIVPEEAEVVKLIYKSFMEGMTPLKIAKMLIEREIPTPAGGKEWHASTIKSILTNEKYKGSALLQKKFTVDFLTKKQKVNEGEVPQYFVEHSHDAIIDPEEFELVQAEMERRKGIGKEYSGSSIFSAKIVCSCCGGFFGSKVWHSTSKYRRVIWQCNHKFKNGEKCTTPHLYEDEIKKRFIEVCNQIATDKEDFLLSCQQIVEMLSNTTALDKKIEAQYIYLNGLAVSMQEFIKENAMKPQDEDFYKKKMAEYNFQKAEAEKVLHDLQDKRAARLSRKELLEGLIRTMKHDDIVTDAFDGKLWLLLVEKATVGTDGKLTFTLRNGVEIEA